MEMQIDVLFVMKTNFIDGDKLIGIIAKRYHKKELLTSDYIIGTQMSNLGLDFFKRIGLKLFRSNVGDRYVTMRKYNSNLGEQSGTYYNWQTWYDRRWIGSFSTNNSRW